MNKNDIPRTKDGKIYLLRSCTADMKGFNDFVWPESGPVEAPDWRNDDECGGGLHGLLWGMGDFSLTKTSKANERKWIIFEADPENIVVLDQQKAKTKKANVIFCGRIGDALVKMAALRLTIAGNDETVTSTTGNYAPASTTGCSAPASTTGNSAPASTTGDYAPASTTGNYAPASTTGNYAPASTTGDYAPASTTGNYAIAAGLGIGSKAKAGKDGVIILRWNDKKRPRVTVGYVGEGGIEADTWYKLTKTGKLTLVPKSEIPQ